MCSGKSRTHKEGSKSVNRHGSGGFRVAFLVTVLAFGKSCRHVPTMSTVTGMRAWVHYPGTCRRSWTLLSGVESGMKSANWSGRWDGEWSGVWRVECVESGACGEWRLESGERGAGS